MFYAVMLLGLSVSVSCLPTPATLSSTHPPTDHGVDILGLSQRITAAMTPLLDVFLAPLVDSLPDDYLNKLAESVKKGTLTGLGPDPMAQYVRHLEDEDKLQLHEDYESNVINKT